MSYSRRVRRGSLARLVKWAALGVGLAGLWLTRPIEPRLLAPPNDDGLTILGRDGTVLSTDSGVFLAVLRDGAWKIQARSTLGS